MQQREIGHKINSFGTLLKQWRDRRSLSQLDLALNSQVSQRHISFLESGRAKPSQEMVLQLANVLEIPLRHQNLLLSAAGFAPIHTESDLSAPEMSSICIYASPARTISSRCYRSLLEFTPIQQRSYLFPQHIHRA